MEFVHTCRICCVGRRKTKNMFNTKINDENIFLFEVFIIVTNISTSEDDSFPKGLCSICTNRLQDAYQLKRQAEKANQELLKKVEDRICNEVIEKLGSKEIDQEVTAYQNSSDIMVKNEKVVLDDSHHESDEYIEKEDFLVDIDELERLLSYDDNSEKSDDEIKILTKSCSVINKRNRNTNPDYNFKQKKSMKPKQKHRCQVCTRDFSRKSNLIDHLRLHANLKLFQCKYCDKSFVQIANYKAHLRIHTKERPFQCHLCTKSYTQSSSLKIHIRSHTDERNYCCDNCGKAFTNSSDLNKHKRLHDPENQFSCDICGKLFAQKVNMHLHVRRVHA